MEQKKKALGRGLEQLFSSEVLDFDTFEDNIMENAKETDIVQLPLSDIRSNPYQPRNYCIIHSLLKESLYTFNNF